MLIKFRNKLKNYGKHLIEKHPFTIFIAEFFLRHFPILLPHDNDYYGFCRLTNKKNGLFLDVGANDGRSILSFHKLKKDWRIFSIEPNPIHKKRLKKIRSRIPKLDFIISAAGESSGRKLRIYVPFYYFYGMHTAASSNLKFLKKDLESLFSKRIVKRFKYREFTTSYIRIDDLNLSPDIVKIDVQGQELNVLLGCKDTIKRCSPCFLVEYDEDNFEKIKEFFQTREYPPYGFNPKNMKFSRFMKGENRNCFFIPSKNG